MERTNELKEWFRGASRGAGMSVSQFGREVCGVSDATMNAVTNLRQPMSVAMLHRLYSKYPLTDADMAMMKKYVRF